MSETEFNTSEIGQDYIRREVADKPHPCIDEFLDYIQHLVFVREEKDFPKGWIEREIEATKEIIIRLTPIETYNF